MSSTEQLTILVPGENLVIVLGRGGGGTVALSGAVRRTCGCPPVLTTLTPLVSAFTSSPLFDCTSQRIRIFWDGHYRVEVTVSMAWQGRLCGLCGNYNDDASDDFTTPAGDLAATEDDFGMSWVTGDTSSCEVIHQDALDQSEQMEN